jgi:hypothetical protein
LKWAAASGGANWSLLNSGGTALTGATTITVSGISGKDKVMVLITSASANASAEIDFRFNADSGSNYYSFGFKANSLSAYSGGAGLLGYQYNGTTVAPFARMSSDGGSQCFGGITLTGCNSSGVKAFQSVGGGTPNGVNGQFAYIGQGYYNSSSTISSVSIISSDGNFDDGTMYVYTSA